MDAVASTASGTVSALISHFSEYLLILPLEINFKPGRTYSWFLRTCPSLVGGVVGATCNDIKQDVRFAFQHWASVVDVHFTEAASSSLADVHVNFLKGGLFQRPLSRLGYAGWNVFDSNFELALSDYATWVPTSHVDDNSVTTALVFRAVLHEIGHFLGLEHPYPSCPGGVYGVMSYCAPNVPVSPSCAEIALLQFQRFTLLSGTVKCAKSVKLVTSTPVGEVIAGSTIPAGVIRFKVTTADGSPIAYFPILVGVQTGGGKIASRAVFSGVDGIVSLPPWTVGSNPGNQCAYAFLLADDRGTNNASFVCATVTLPAAPTINLSATSAAFTVTALGANPTQTAIAVSNGGTGNLTGLNLGAIFYQGQTNGWLTASLNLSTAPATLTLAPTNLAGIQAGTYVATVQVISNAAGVTNSPRTITVSLTVTPPTIAINRTSVLFNATSGGSSPSAEIVSISNGGGGILNGLSTSVVNYRAGEPSGWLGTPTLSATTAPATLTFRPNTTALSNGTYHATIVVSAGSGTFNNPVSIDIEYAVSSAPVLSAPTQITPAVSVKVVVA